MTPHPSLLEQWDVDIPAPAEPVKTYLGRRWPSGVVEVTVVADGKERLLSPSREQMSAGYEWGYNGAGPTALAAALLADHLGYEAPIDTYIAFRRAVVSRLRRDGWAIGSPDVSAWLSTHLTGGRP